ncbi:hypothetical protein GCM10027296_24110 [Chitinimonas naiadis]
MQLDIQRLVLTLPPEFGGNRAQHIARLTGEALAAHLPAHVGGELASLRVPPLTVQAAWSDHRVASHIASALHGAISRQQQGGQ